MVVSYYISQARSEIKDSYIKPSNQSLYLISSKSFYWQISWRLETARLGEKVMVSSEILRAPRQHCCWDIRQIVRAIVLFHNDFPQVVSSPNNVY